MPLGFYAKSLARGHFLFFIPPPSSLDYKGCHTLGGIKAFVVVKAVFPSCGCSL